MRREQRLVFGEVAELYDRHRPGYREVNIEQSDFEQWDPAGREFALLFAAQAWHWVEPEVGFAKAASVLRPGGVLATFWNRPMRTRAELREVLIDAYRQAAPEVLDETDPMHPSNSASGDEVEWRDDIAATAGLGAAEVRDYEWSETYTGGDYASLLQTHSTVRVLDPDRRHALAAAIASAIESHGDVLELPLVTRVYLARRLDTP